MILARERRLISNRDPLEDVEKFDPLMVSNQETRCSAREEMERGV